MRVLQGLAVSPGYGKGVAVPYRREDYLYRAAATRAASGSEESELERLESARRAAVLDLEALVRNLEQNYNLDERQIFHAHFLILEDEQLIHPMRERIAKGGSAEAAVVEAVASVEGMFRQHANPYLRDRAADVHDVGRRILEHLVDRHHDPFSDLPDAAIIVADDLLPSDTVFLDRHRVRAIITERGSENSHAAILSRAFGIPSVTGVTGLLDTCKPGDSLSVDGETGRVFLHIEGRTETDYARRARGYHAAIAEVSRQRDRAVTLDGVEIALLANVDREEDIEVAVEHRADGIGLLRTEMFYFSEGAQVSERRQEEVFRLAVRRMGTRPIHVRILDLAPDKALPLSGDSPLAGAAIADCGIHFALAHPELLRPQLRAILRASEEGTLRILLPGVTGPGEIEAFRTVLDQAAYEIYGEAGCRSRPMLIGAMIETPSALFMLPEIAVRTDFLSLGTNDLLRHLFGRERGRVQETIHEPSLLRAMDMAVQAAADSGTDLEICGEIAGNPALTSLLVGLGFRALSMSPRRLPEVRYNVSRIRVDQSTELARRVLALPSAEQVDRFCVEHADPWHQLVRAREAAQTG